MEKSNSKSTYSYGEIAKKVCEMVEKKKAHNIAIIILLVLFMVMVLFTIKNLFNALTNFNLSLALMFEIPILVTFGAIVSLTKIRLKLNHNND